MAPDNNNTTHVHAPDAPDSVVMSAPTVNQPVIHPVPPSQPGERKQEEDANEDPANFNRVRIKTRKLRKLDLKATGGVEPPEKRNWENNVDIDSVSESPRVRPESLVREKEGATTKMPSQKRSTPRATEEDAKRAGIPAGYSYKDWDPEEEPIMLLGSVFDANSLGKWIYDWTVYHHGPRTPLAEMAGELWLLLTQLAGKFMRAEKSMSRIRLPANKEMVEDFLESGDRLWIRLAKLLKGCEEFMLEAANKKSGDKQPLRMGKKSGFAFVDTIFGIDRALNKTEKLMTGIRLWSMRFDAHCEPILRHPSQ